MSTEFESRFSSQKPEDIAWRLNVAHVDAAIEGIESNPHHDDFFTNQRNKGIPEDKIRELFTNQLMTKMGNVKKV